MSETVQIDDLGNAIINALQEYSDDVAVAVKNSVDIVAKETNEEIKSHVTFKGKGDYVKAFRLNKSYEDHFEKRVTWYVKEPHYRLTHLLENGHAKRNGGRTEAFPHIQYGQEFAEKRMVELAEEAIKNV